MKRVSPKQAKENQLRLKVKALLLEESGGLCSRCGQSADFRGLELVHLKALSLGGKTTLENCRVWCGRCHSERHELREKVRQGINKVIVKV